MFTQISAHEVMQLLAQWDTHEEAWHEAPMSSHEADDIAIGLVEAGMRTWASPGVPPVMRRSLYARIGRSGVCRCAPESALENFRRMAAPPRPSSLRNSVRSRARTMRSGWLSAVGSEQRCSRSRPTRASPKTA